MSSFCYIQIFNTVSTPLSRVYANIKNRRTFKNLPIFCRMDQFSLFV
jgi:hypothetical protein